MITFKSHDDLLKLNNHDPAYPVMEELVRLLIDGFTEPGQTLCFPKTHITLNQAANRS